MSTSRLFGDWDKFRHILTKLSDNEEQYFAVGRSMGDKIAEKIWDTIESQEPDFAPLVEEYRQQKIREGYYDRIMIRTGDYLNSIQVTNVESNGDQLSVFVGVEGGKTETKLDMTELAQFLEYGTSKMPARFPITQSWDIIKDEVKKEVADRLKLIIEGDLR